MDVIEAVRVANLKRTHTNLIRRMLKVVEELGEASEAYLNVTSAANAKEKTYEDVREELIDTAIVTLDCALTRFPGEENRTDESIRAEIDELFVRKLAKWVSGRSTAQSATQTEDDV